MPYLQRVLDGADEDLANRVRASLRLPLKLKKTGTPEEAAAEARIMADRSLDAGYLKDALKYLKVAHDADPVDFSLMLKLGSVYNMLHDDATAVRWFQLAKQSDDDAVADKAGTSLRALQPSIEPYRSTMWSFPMFSTRWKDLFSYAQWKTDRKLKSTSLFRPYFSVRFVGDTRGTLPSEGPSPLYLSESAFIVGGGLATRTFYGAMAWAEAGSSIGYLSHHVVPDYRGGVTWARTHGANIFSEERGFFWETNDDLVFVSRFDRDTLGYTQNRVGYTPATLPLQTQLFWNFNVTTDVEHQTWANFAETGPGVRFHWTGTPHALTFSVSALRGIYLINQGQPAPSEFQRCANQRVVRPNPLTVKRFSISPSWNLPN